jgi:hypothetical protein
MFFEAKRARILLGIIEQAGLSAGFVRRQLAAGEDGVGMAGIVRVGVCSQLIGSFK